MLLWGKKDCFLYFQKCKLVRLEIAHCHERGLSLSGISKLSALFNTEIPTRRFHLTDPLGFPACRQFSLRTVFSKKRDNRLAVDEKLTRMQR